MWFSYQLIWTLSTDIWLNIILVSQYNCISMFGAGSHCCTHQHGNKICLLLVKHKRKNRMCIFEATADFTPAFFSRSKMASKCSGRQFRIWMLLYSSGFLLFLSWNFLDSLVKNKRKNVSNFAYIKTLLSDSLIIIKIVKTNRLLLFKMIKLF